MKKAILGTFAVIIISVAFLYAMVTHLDKVEAAKAEAKQNVYEEFVEEEVDNLCMSQWSVIEIMYDYDFGSNSALGESYKFQKDSQGWYAGYFPDKSQIESPGERNTYVDKEIVDNIKAIIKEENGSEATYAENEVVERLIIVSGELDDEPGLDTKYIKLDDASKIESLLKEIEFVY